ncbi:hypothetical protein [Lewinella sp. JB7]|uniref:hypothetical protein n=1 Tax=Lewinella sp. JB7 TaxID=2962887 RepID=UPI0020C9ABB8|nr:hypothetical protein [Lewinella sp. JB7]MCP9234390.1 hypothetical protein [Lewinella sp. JB7]
MREQRKKAFDFAAESTKLLITLSTGMIALTITFSQAFISDTAKATLWPLLVAWACYLVSVVFGIATMLSLTGTLSEVNSADETGASEPSVYAPSITGKSLLQIAFFLLALAFTCVHGCVSITNG